MLEAVIFDMDGVLIDSEPMHAEVAIQVLKEYGIDVTTEYMYQFIGTTAKKMFKTMIKEFDLNTTLEELMELDAKILAKFHEKEGYPAIEGTKELIIDLYNHGIKLAVASSSSAALIEEVTKALGIFPYFTKLVSGMDVEHPKPAPDVFLKAANQLGVSPSNCIIFEDSTVGVAAAEAASIKSIGFLNTNSGNQDLSKATILIESFKDIDYEFVRKEYMRAYGEPITIVTTDRLIVRELTTKDIEALYPMYKKPEVTQFIDEHIGSLEEETMKLESYIKNVYGFYGYGLWGVYKRDSNSLIGRCGIQCNRINDDVEFELGYLIDSNYWGNGYATESAKAVITYAKEELEINRIVSVIDDSNIKSITVAKNIGMKKEKDILYHNRNCSLFVI